MMKFPDRDLMTRFTIAVVFVALTVSGLFFFVYLLGAAHTPYMYALAFAYMVMMVISDFFNIFTAYSYYHSYFYDAYIKKLQASLKPLKRIPTVAMVVTMFNEDTEIVKRTLLSLMKVQYPKESAHFYLLDDSTDAEKAATIRAFSAEHGVTYIHREGRRGFKGGNLNNFLKQCQEEFIAIFDFDEYLTDAGFLRELLPYFVDKKLSFVQTEKRYAKSTFFADSVALIDGFFFRFIQPSRALNGTAIFAGSCGIVRTSHLKEVGGFPDSVTEDSFFSFESDTKGYKGLYVPKIYALGKPITTFTELVKQQWRYNFGGTQFIGYFMARLNRKSNKRKITPLASIDYVMHGLGLNYISIMFILFTILSVLITLTGFPVQNLNIMNLLSPQYLSLDLEIVGVGALFVSIMMPMVLARVYFQSFRKGIMLFILNFALAFVRAKAAFAAMLNKSKRIVWDHGKFNDSYGRALYAVRNSAMESTFAVGLLVLSLSAVVLNNFIGGFWLLWYGLLYISTLIMFYKYG